MAEVERSKSSPLLVLVTWTVVVLPTLWGLSYTVKNAMKLFVAPRTGAAAPASPGPVTPTPR